ncbi:hypothetical protein GJ697_20905 [Pseudoduganella sp. FT25W]|uniref:Uncharacterized protein n=1 Tax=Duganella alba TaxID=2666081 RepID=A0A6L5QKJ2_9BURK|nr:hypothetical protein [Duganella alba]MRX10296.1 hypothetical protein [Duganella alba]MRX18583.1 hypothetical protein [Duganella alba]
MNSLFRLLILCLCTVPLAGRAATPAEQGMSSAPMPHALLAAPGAPVKVHLVSLRGYLIGQPDNAARLAMLHAEVEDCVRRNNAAGAASKPPRAWPEHVDSQRHDVYSAVNRTIHYTSALTYGVNQLDCSLTETHLSRASLFSSRGICDIDLLKKTAHGACDAAGQASAKPPSRRPGLTAEQIAAIERDAAGNPAKAAMAAAIRANPPSGTGEHKTILGIECDVWKSPLNPEGTVCLSRGGSFPASTAPGAAQSAMALEEDSATSGIKLLATTAQLDTLVNGAVFTPYLSGGFRIANTGTRP